MRPRNSHAQALRFIKAPLGEELIGDALDLSSDDIHNGRMSDEGAVRMEVKGLVLDPSSNVPIVILKDLEEEIFLPIWIGVSEANAIALRLEGIEPPRPLTHDLLQAILDEHHSRVEQVLISDLRDNTFYAVIRLAHNGSHLELDSRPSDAIALAIRVDAPIFVAQAVLAEARSVQITDDKTDEDRLREWLEQAGPEDLGEYEM